MAELELQESVIHINRVAKVVKGGRNFAFTALVAVGDGNGKAGIGYGKGSEVPQAIQKAIENAKKNIQDIPMAGSTIVHSIIGKHGSSRVLLKPAALVQELLQEVQLGRYLKSQVLKIYLQNLWVHPPISMLPKPQLMVC